MLSPLCIPAPERNARGEKKSPLLGQIEMQILVPSRQKQLGGTEIGANLIRLCGISVWWHPSSPLMSLGCLISTCMLRCVVFAWDNTLGDIHSLNVLDWHTHAHTHTHTHTHTNRTNSLGWPWRVAWAKSVRITLVDFRTQWDCWQDSMILTGMGVPIFDQTPPECHLIFRDGLMESRLRHRGRPTAWVCGGQPRGGSCVCVGGGSAQRGVWHCIVTWQYHVITNHVK